jgi:hypothetical protein
MKWFFKCFLASIVISWIMGATGAYATTYSYTPLNYPGSIATAPMSINNSGYIVGDYVVTREPVIIGGVYYSTYQAFIYNGSFFQSIQIDGAISIDAFSINNSGVVAGAYTDSNGKGHGFTYDNGSVTTYDITVFGLTGAIIKCINDNGVMVGTVYNGLSLIGFKDDGGVITPIPGWPNSINNIGQIVGVSSPGWGTSRGILYSNGNVLAVPPPDNLQSQAFGINNFEQIVGDYYPSGQRSGFLFDGTNVIRFNYPDSNTATYLTGINDLGTVVGVYNDTSLGYSRSLGFIATPTPIPLPSAVLLLGAGLFRLAAYGRRRMKG